MFDVAASRKLLPWAAALPCSRARPSRAHHCRRCSTGYQLLMHASHRNCRRVREPFAMTSPIIKDQPAGSYLDADILVGHQFQFEFLTDRAVATATLGNRPVVWLWNSRSPTLPTSVPI